MVNKPAPSAMTEQQQYQAIEHSLSRAGYTHKAYVEERPKIGHGSLVFSTLSSSPAHLGHGTTGLEFSSKVAAPGVGMGSIATGASSMYGGGGGGSMQICSPVSAGAYTQKRYAHTVRSSASSILSLGRQKTEPPVIILPHYNSPYESLFFNQPDVIHFVGKDIRIGTICISFRPTPNVIHFIVRTVLKFVSIDIPDSYRSSPKFEQCRSFYQKKNDLLPLLHTAVQHCFESIPESDVRQHHVVQHQSAADHSVFVLDEPGWMQSTGFILSLVKGLEEIRQEGFSHVLKNLEAQMRPAALSIDFVIPDQDAASGSEKKFWDFFNGLGDRVESGTYLPQAPKACLSMPTMSVGDKTQEQRLEALTELIETESKYNARMRDLVHVYLAEARAAATGPNRPLGKYEIRVIFSNIEQILTASILSGTSQNSSEVDGIRQAAEIASEIAHMDKAKPEQNAEILFNIRNIIENCPDSLLSQSRSAVTYLDGHETNMLTGERGKPITLILFSDKVMIARRPKNASGEYLFRLKDDEEERKRLEKKDRERRERERKSRKDGKNDMLEDKDESESSSSMNGPAYTGPTFNILRKDWKFMGWMDLLKIRVAVVEQTDPEGLFCITTQSHMETMDDPLENTRGILPEHLDRRDTFISKFYETLTLAKAALPPSSHDSSMGASDYTSRLHVAELELFCNVFTASQYRDFAYKGDIALFYPGGPSSQPPMDITRYTKLPTFAGIIQSTESGLRVILKGKASLNGAANAASSSEHENRFLDADAFQIHITEIVSNLQWTVYHFDPYQNAQLHFSRVYLRTDYLKKIAINDRLIVRKLYSLIRTSSLDLLNLELQNYRSAIAYEVFKIYLEELCTYTPLVARADIQQKFGACLHDHKSGNMDDLILLRLHTYLDNMKPESQYIFGNIISCYIRVRNSNIYHEHSDLLAIKFAGLILLGKAPSSESVNKITGEDSTSVKQESLLLEIWARFYPKLWADGSKSVIDSQHESTSASHIGRSKSPHTLLPSSDLRPGTDADASTHSVDSSILSPLSSQMSPSRIGIDADVIGVRVTGHHSSRESMVASATEVFVSEVRSTVRQVHFADDDSSAQRGFHNSSSKIEHGEDYPPRNEVAQLSGLKVLLNPHLIKAENADEDDPVFKIAQRRRNMESIRSQMQQLRDNFLQELQFLDTQVARHGALSRESSTSSSCTAVSVSLQESETKFLDTISEDQDHQLFTANEEGELAEDIQCLDLSTPRSPHGVPKYDFPNQFFQNGSDECDAAPKKGHRVQKQLMVEEYCEEDECGPRPYDEVDGTSLDGYPSMTNDVDISSPLFDADSDAEKSRGGLKVDLGMREQLKLLPTDFTQMTWPSRRKHTLGYMRQLRDQVTAITECNLEFLDKCLAAVEESQEDVEEQWEMIAHQHEQFKEQSDLASQYQIKLEHENEAIKDLYDEVTEENNILYDRFNDEMATIFEAVRSNVDLVDPEGSVRSVGLNCDSDGYRDLTASPLPLLPSTDSDDHNDPQNWNKECQSESLLRQLLQKAVQDRSLAEQQARRAILQASYFRDLLERHGIDIGSAELFE
ncbi:hypothetical protein BGX28_001527 [Mortierella sp. GBA30]|nr:hypothetical protein BGX28_001527 [Mortierella sp. GBA30]